MAEKTLVTKKQLTVSIIFNGINSFLFLIYLIKLLFNLSSLKYLTMLSYYINSIHLLICLYCDVKIYDLNKNSLYANIEESLNYSLIAETPNPDNEQNKIIFDTFIEKLNDWNRNKLGVICNTFSYFISIIYWILFSMGDKYMKIESGFFAVFDSIYVHLIITIIVIIDVFSSQRKVHIFSWGYYSIIAGLFISYCVYNYIDKQINLSNSYTFLRRSTFFLIFSFILALIILLFCYLNHIYLIRYKY